VERQFEIAVRLLGFSSALTLSQFFLSKSRTQATISPAMPPAERPPKVFISYSHDTPEHIERVLALGQRLLTDGVDVVLDRLVFPPPSNWPLWMEDQMSKADFILVACSEGYLKKVQRKTKKGTGKGVKFESLLSYQQIYDNDSDSSQFIPVLLERGEYEHIPKPMRGGNHYKPGTQKGDYEALLRHLTNQPEFIRSRPGPLRDLPPRTVQPFTDEALTASNAGIFLVPQEQNPTFTGRDQLLENLRADLLKDRRQALRGLGGIGKTQIAVEYAYRHRDSYSAVLWTFAESVASLTAGFAQIATKLGLPGAASQEQAVMIEAVKTWLEQNEGCLLVLDNADQPDLVKPFLPLHAQGHILLTSRAAVFQTIGVFHPREVDVLESSEAAEFLLKRTGTDGAGKSPQADALAKALGYLPLALEQAAAYIQKTGTDFKKYLASFNNQGLKLLNKQGPILGNPQEQQKRTVATTWAVNFMDVEKHSPASAQILRLSAFLAPDMIPLELLERGGRELGEPLAPQLARVKDDPLAMDELLQPLVDYSLVHRNPETNSYSIHPLVQEVMREGLGAAQEKAWAERAVRVVNAAFPFADFQNWPDCDRLLPHALACAGLIHSYALEFAAAGCLLNNAGGYLHDRAQHAQTESLYRQALAIREKVEGVEHPDTAISLNNMASLLSDQGKYAEAEPLYLRALGINEKVLGTGHPDTAQILNNLAELYRTQDKYTEAEPLHRQALQIREKALEAEHPKIATSLNNLALLLDSRGKHAEAEPLHRRALAMLEKALGIEHPKVAASLNNLGLLLNNKGKYDEAEALYRRALDIGVKALGAEHPDVAQSLNNLALLLNNKGKYDEAEPLYRWAVTIAKKALTDAHPTTQLCIRNLALLYRERGRVKDAEEMERRLNPIQG
jgi:tetratricopeptide (TPR) repeat protein